MIDYLERLFTVEVQGEGENPEVKARIAPLAEEAAEAMPYPRFVPEDMENQMSIPETTEQFWQSEGARRVEHTLSDAPTMPRRLESVLPEELVKVGKTVQEPIFDRWTGITGTRTGIPEAQESLERRLRRDSRRYDSGFFWY